MPRTTTKTTIEPDQAGEAAAARVTSGIAPQAIAGSTPGTQPAATPGAKSFFLKTFGCQMNVYDSERMTEALARDGYRETKVIEDADLVILNTCHIREKAAEKVYSDLGRIRAVKTAREADGKETLITVAGCVAQAEGQEIVRRQPAVDLVIGPQSYHRLGTLLQQARRDGRAVVETEFAENAKFEALPKARRLSGPSAFLTVQEGCDKFCTFCVVPYTRGEEFSRPAAEVIAEAQRLVDAGAREIMLLGQNVNAYHGAGYDGAGAGGGGADSARAGGGDVSLAALIRALAKIDGLDRIRYTTSHPRDMRDDLIAAHAEVDALMPYLHLPVQAGSDRILAAMNRRHTAEEYLRIIERVRAARPDIALSGDFIVGFPGETDEDFEATMALVREVRYAQAFSFKYSPRAGTPAAGHGAQVPDAVKSERLQRLQALLEEQQVAFNAACVGRELPVLFERQGRAEGVLVGRTPYLQLIHVDDAGGLAGEIGTAKVTGFRQMSLTGQLVPVTGAA